jgi:hypothetical protein
MQRKKNRKNSRTAAVFICPAGFAALRKIRRLFPKMSIVFIFLFI